MTGNTVGVATLPATATGTSRRPPQLFHLSQPPVQLVKVRVTTFP